jgi:hypothetical protein
MAGKAKSVYLVVCPKRNHLSVFKKVFFNAKDFRDYVSTEEFKTLYPEDKFDIIKEVY